MSGFTKYIGIILFFPIIVFFFLFSYNVVQDTGDDYIINVSYNTTLGLIDDGELEMSNDMRQFLVDSRAQYYDTDLPIDLIFLAFWIDVFLMTVWSSFMSRKKSIYTFYGMVTFGAMLFLFVGSFMDQIVVWLFENFYLNFFNLSRAGTPIANFYINNSQKINFLWFAIVLIINQFDFQFILGKVEGRFEA